MKAITRFSNSLMEKYLPDPFLFVIILTLVIFVMGLGVNWFVACRDGGVLGWWILGITGIFDANGIGVSHGFCIGK